MEIQRGMYGIKQAGKLANEKLQERLIPHGYRPCRNTPGIWAHDNKPITFSLIVNDGVVEELNVEGPGEFNVSSCEFAIGQTGA